MLMQRLVDDCRVRGLAQLWGYVLLENRPMLQLCEGARFQHAHDVRRTRRGTDQPKPLNHAIRPQPMRTWAATLHLRA